MNTPLLTILLLITGPLTVSCQPSSAWISELIDHRDASPAMHYDVRLAAKLFSMDDTMDIQASVILVRDTADTVFGGRFVLDMDTIWMGYDGTHLLQADLHAGELTIVDPAENPGAFIRSTIYNNLLESGFFSRSRSLLEALSDTSLRVTGFDSLIGARHVPAIRIDMPGQESFSGEHIIFTFNPDTRYYHNRIHSVWYQDNEQYMAWTFPAVTYTRETLIPHWSEESLSGFRQIQYGDQQQAPRQAQQESDIMPYEAGKQINLTKLQGTWLQDQRPANSADLQGEDLILLDFWYTACYPCIKSIPAINRIADEYGGKGLRVVGVNPIDSPAANTARIEKFLHNNPMAYPTVMIAKEEKSYWAAPAYPTVLLMDGAGVILYMKTGYSPTAYEDISAELKKHLGE